MCPIRPVIIPDVSSQPHRSDDQHNDGGEDYLFARAILQLSIIGSGAFDKDCIRVGTFCMQINPYLLHHSCVIMTRASVTA